METTTKYTTRGDAIAVGIVRPIEDSEGGRLTLDAYAEYDIDAIADEVILEVNWGTTDYGFIIDIDPDDFWEVVLKHAR